MWAAKGKRDRNGCLERSGRTYKIKSDADGNKETRETAKETKGMFLRCFVSIVSSALPWKIKASSVATRLRFLFPPL